jgi:ABC-type iron transport system FetAB ATPase subunit
VTELDQLAQRVLALRRQADADAGAAQELALRGKAAEQAVAELRERLEVHESVVATLTRIGEERQESARRQIEELVTRGLQAIFEDNLSFHAVQSVRSNAVSIEFIVRSAYGDQVVETSVLDARGGGLAVVVAFMLRLIVLLLTPGARRALFLDESFSHVSAEYEPRVAEFLREVCDKAGVQILLITHSRAYDDLADQHYRTALAPDGITVLEGLSADQLC